MMLRRLVLASLGIALATPAHADDGAEGPGLPSGVLEDAPEQVEVIQRRKFELSQELSLSAGVLPVDPYYKGITATAAYTAHFSQSWAWEVAHLTYSFNVDTHLKEQLLEVAAGRGNQAPQLAEIEWVAGTRLLLKPLYGKEALFNTEVVHLEAYLGLGPVLVKRSAPLDSIGFGGDFGAGLRLWLSPRWSMRLDLGELLFVEEERAGGIKLRQALHMQLGMSLALGGDT